MDKDNIFKSCNFYLDDGDVVHVLIKDFVGDNLSISLNDNVGTQEDDTEIAMGGELYVGTYGALYNWYAATDARGITSDGWHVPTDAEFATLVAYLVAWFAGGKLKEMGTIYWDTPNTGATNEVGFNGRGAGYRNYLGVYSSVKEFCYLISSVEEDPGAYYNLTFTYNSAGAAIGYSDKKDGSILRPIKNSTTLLHGETGTYTSNDGKVYNTICIGTQEWLSQNLAETKFRNGENIPVVENAAAWAALTTAGMCYYNNVEI